MIMGDTVVAWIAVLKEPSSGYRGAQSATTKTWPLPTPMNYSRAGEQRGSLQRLIITIPVSLFFSASRIQSSASFRDIHFHLHLKSQAFL